MPAVSQLAEVRGQNSSEGGQVNLGPAVTVVVRAQAAAENNIDLFIVSVNPSLGGLGPVDVVEVVGEAGEARAEVRTRQQRPQPRPAPDTRAEVGHQRQQLSPGQRRGQHRRVLAGLGGVVVINISRSCLQLLLHMLELSTILVSSCNSFLLRPQWNPVKKLRFFSSVGNSSCLRIVSRVNLDIIL